MIQIRKLALLNKVEQIYLGAGNQSIIRYYHIVFELLEEFNVTLEVSEENFETLPNELVRNEKLHIVLTLKNNSVEQLKGTDTIKIESDKNVFCCEKNEFVTNNLKKGYKNDEVIE